MSFAYPKASFRWDIESEVERIVHASLKTANGFYIAKGFYVVPEIENGDVSCVCLPRLKYEKSYWKAILKVKEELPIQVPEAAKQFLEAQQLIDSQSNPSRILELSKQWKDVEHKFWNIFYGFFPNLLGSVKALDIRITSYGTVASFGEVHKGNPIPLTIYLRKDFGVEHIAEAIITSSLYSEYGYSPSSWELVEGVTDVLLTKSVLATVFPKYKPTLDSIRFNLKHIEKSRQYLSQIGVPDFADLKIKEDKIYLGSGCIDRQLTSVQSKLLKIFLQNPGKIISIDEIADLIWAKNSSEKYSLWAINKHIQRLRDKLAELGVNSALITPVRGRGYAYK